MKALVIAEKPSLMRDMQAVYRAHQREIGYSCDFLFQAGHLIEMLLPKEIDAEKYGKWRMEDFPQTYPYRYRVMKDKRELYGKIKDAVNSGGYDFIIHAGDPEQEGELLVRLVLNHIGNTLPVKRFWTNDTSAPAILSAMQNLREDSEFDLLYEAGLLRQHIDYQFGMNLTGVTTLKMNDLCRLGRVKAPIIFLIVTRELAIRNFVEKTTYKPIFLYRGCEFVYSKAFDEKADAEKIWNNADHAITVNVTKEKKKTKAPKLFKLSSLQVAAYKAFRWNAAKTLSVMQSIYEKHIVTYPRTACEYISTQVDIGDIKDKVLNFWNPEHTGILVKSAEEIKKDKTYCNDKAIASEGHTGIIPTGQTTYDLTDDERDLYELICRQFLAIFAKEKETLHTRVEAYPAGMEASASIEENIYVHTEKEDLEPGFELILNQPLYEIPSTYIPASGSGVTFSKGEELRPIEFMVKEVVSKPPARYNSGSLIKALTDPDDFRDPDGTIIKYTVGTEATRAKIIEDCIKTGYFEDKKGIYYALPKGEALIENFKDIPIYYPAESGHLEAILMQVRNGELSSDDAMKILLSLMEQYILKIKSMQLSAVIPKTAQKGTVSLGKCPKCSSDVLVGKFGPYCASKCGMYLTKAMGHDLTQTQLKSLLAGKKILIKGLKSQKGTTYDAYMEPNPEGAVSEYSKKDGSKGYGWNIKVSFPPKNK